MKYFDFDLKLLGKITQKLYKENVFGLLKERRVYNYLNKYMSVAANREFSLDKIDETIQDEVVWVCWFQGVDNAPPVVKACIASIKKYVSKKVILITADNYAEFANIPAYICQKWKNGKISNAHFSDILRVSLLAVYGGCWIDATVYLMDEVPEFMISSSLFCFDISRYGRKFKLASNWWIAANKRQPIIIQTRNVLYEYWKHENEAIEYFMFHKIFKKVIETRIEYKTIWSKKRYFEVGHTHILSGCLNDQFNSNKLHEIKSLCPIQKLTYKGAFSDSHNTFFNNYIMGNKVVDVN